MFRKVFVFLLVIVAAPSVFALNKEELAPEFFGRFNDEYLVKYINEAYENNHDAKQAGARVEQYRQQAKSSLGKELPSLSVGANYLGTHTPNLGSRAGFNLDESAFVVPFIARYEADVLLKNRDRTRSAQKSAEVSQQDEKAVYLALFADVATVYVNILQYDELINIQNEKVLIYKNMFVRDEKKFQRGVIDSSQINTSQKNLYSAKNRLTELQKQREVLLMQLAVLTGNSADCIDNIQRGVLEKFEYGAVIPTEISSDVIFARPDVVAAEKRLEKAKIDTRVARKEFFPRFNIIGIWAFNTISGGTFFSWENSLAAILAGATQDIFRGGQKVAGLKFQKAKYEELFENYQQINLNAVKEVNTALCYIKHDFEIEENTKEKIDLEYNSFENSKKKFERGVISNPQYLNDLILFLNVQNEVIQAKSQRLVDYFTLYKAVGGQL